MALTAAQRIDAVAPLAEQMLPPSARPVEKALLAAELAALADVDPTVIATIYDPWRCPTSLLPWLAWSVSVDVWNTDWSEIEKRREIAASPEIHRRKGTRGAIERTLDRLGLSYDITEWFDVSPPARRGTFKVFVDAETRNTSAVRDEATSRVSASKPMTRIFDLKIGVQETGPLGVAAATLTKSLIVADPFIIDGPAEETGPIGIAAATLTRSLIIADPFMLSGPVEEIGPLGIAAATVTRSIITLEAA